jgi:hypothetical protein
MTASGTFSTDLSGLAANTTYYFRAQADGGANGMGYGMEGSFTTLPAPSPTPTPTPPGGGGGGGGGSSVAPGYTSLAPYINDEGFFNLSATINTDDGRIHFSINKGTVAKDKYGNRLTQIGIFKITEPVAPPQEAHIIGSAYNLNPEGATFDPTAMLTFSYNELDIPQGGHEEGLVIAYWDPEAGRWVALENSVVDTVHNTITAPVNHFSVFAVLGYEVAVPAPAIFELNSLSVSPAEACVGDKLSFDVLVTNVGGVAGTYKVILRIDGVVESTKEVSLDLGTSQVVSFTIDKVDPGSHTAEANGLTVPFMVSERPAVADGQSGPEITVFSARPKYDTETHQPVLVEVTYEVSKLYQPTIDIELIVQVTLNGELLEEVPVSLSDQSEQDPIKGILDYKPPQGWETGTYTFQAKLYINGEFVLDTSLEELKVTAPPEITTFSWSILGKIIGIATFAIAVTVFAILLRRRHILRAGS